ncbi:hypothetical protein NM208_g579 [Fusarium decemcellulare]|uniref:Uncharacterized protein n=1 Tax=Fusarium decemcellulare TaxID=57161 RepID=A0ACC1SZ65_9HYPO|nr:hypothetical protein NM208_g579 [Fusarium decemcellulare]
MAKETSVPLSQGASHPTETLTSPAVAPPLTYRSIAPAPNPADWVEPGANRSPRVPSAPPSRRPYPSVNSSPADASYSIGRTQLASPQFTFSLPISESPSPTTSTPFSRPFNPLSTDPEPSLSHSIKRPSQEPNESTDYNSETQSHAESAAGGEKETGERLTTLYVDPENHPAYKELEARIHQAHNDEDRWKACIDFLEKYKFLKKPVFGLDNEIENQRRKLEEIEAARNDKESNIDALVLLGTQFMLSKCERFSQIQRSYSKHSHKRPRDSDCTKQRDFQVAVEDWADFLDQHIKASRDLQQCRKALEYIGSKWGDERIRYYGWATKTLTVCRQVKAAAKAVPDWKEAGIKLNRLRNHRDRGIGNPIAAGKRSISWKDFECLRKWKGRDNFELPPSRKRAGDRIIPYALLSTSDYYTQRLGFDKFGILVVKSTKSDDEVVITFAAPPWGMAQSQSIRQGFGEQEDVLKSLPKDQDGGLGIYSEDKTAPATSIRESARLATRQQPSYSNQQAPTAKRLHHQPRKRPETENHVAHYGDESIPIVQQASEREGKPPVVGAEGFCADIDYNQECKSLALDELKVVGDEEWWGAESSRSCRHYLSISHFPTIDEGDDPADAHFCTLSEAEELVDKTTPKIPIFTRCDNASNWKANTRPIMDYLLQANKAETTKEADVQKYCLDLKKDDSYVTTTFWDITAHFGREYYGDDGLDLWNALDLKNHLKDRHVPEFLRNGNCSLLAEMRQRVEGMGGAKKGKTKQGTKVLAKDPLHFALIADGGMNTYPHTDSHGYSTFLTLQEGELIFGWLSRPDDETWDRWAQNPRYFKDGKWCYIVLKPGDSVYLPPGLPHYVVRRNGTQTFILGGHVLQWSNLGEWTSLLRKQIEKPETTNEDMISKKVHMYVEIASGLVEEAIESGNDRLGYLGGVNGAEQTLRDLIDLKKMVEGK